jgi:hypothetical protein
MDYGEAWEDAWEQHVRDWKPSSDQDSVHHSVTRLNLEMDEDILVMGDLRSYVPPRVDDMYTVCRYARRLRTRRTDATRSAFEDDVDDWDTLSDEEILKTFGSDGSRFSVPYPTLWPCSVISKDTRPDHHNDDGSASTTYTVRIFQSDVYRSADWSKRGVPYILYNYPRESIRYVTTPYHSDQHLPNAFRHAIEIRDEILPEQWKNDVDPETLPVEPATGEEEDDWVAQQL